MEVKGENEVMVVFSGKGRIGMQRMEEKKKSLRA